MDNHKENKPVEVPLIINFAILFSFEKTNRMHDGSQEIRLIRLSVDWRGKTRDSFNCAHRMNLHACNGFPYARTLKFELDLSLPNSVSSEIFAFIRYCLFRKLFALSSAIIKTIDL